MLLHYLLYIKCVKHVKESYRRFLCIRLVGDLEREDSSSLTNTNTNTESGNVEMRVR